MRWRRSVRAMGLAGALWLAGGCLESSSDSSRERDLEVPAQPAQARVEVVEEGGQTRWKISAVADTRVEQSAPARNFGSFTRMYVDRSPLVHGYLKFRVEGLRGQHVIAAKLRMFATSGTDSGPSVWVTQTPWSEYALTWETRMQVKGLPLANLGAVAANSWIELDVTQALASGEGEYSFHLVPTSKDGLSLITRESERAALHPHLLLTLAPDATAATRVPAAGT
jgi:hypothetical protein